MAEPLKMVYEKDAPLTALQGKTVAIIGFGSQGHAHALNLRDSGIKVIVANRKDSANGRLPIKPTTAIGVTHGFNVHFKTITPAATNDVLLVAPKGPGHLVRSEFEKGGGVPCLLAIHQNASGKAREIGLAWARGIGGGRAG